MLVLSRRKDESIHIGDDVVINVAAIRKGLVKLTIDAPRHVPVYRSELRERMTDTLSVRTGAKSRRSRREGKGLPSVSRRVGTRPSTG